MAGEWMPVLPRGRRDVVRQAVIWLAFLTTYETARALARVPRAEAVRHGRDVISIERGLGAFVEPELQRRAIGAGRTLIAAANWTYWLAEFGVVTAVLVWTYFRRTERYTMLRNALIATNLLGYLGYVLVPTAPPRLIPGHGFVDTLATSSALNHGTTFVSLAANPYAAMPSLHTADALVVGVVMAALARRRLVRVAWLAWPVWVTFALIVTANHFWLDSACGVAVAIAGGGAALLAGSRPPRPHGRRARRPSAGLPV